MIPALRANLCVSVVNLTSLLHLPLQRLDRGIAEAEMMRDLVHQHVAHQAVQVLAGLDPLHQDRLAIEEDQVRLDARCR